MLKEFLTIYSNCDGLPLSTAIFIPEEEVKGIVQISHGMAEHKERYFSFMEYLTERNYVVVINDLGYFYDESGEYIVKDLHQITLYMKERFPGKPVYLFGHSMGSMAVRMYIKKYDSEIDKLIVCGSPSKNPLVDVALFVVRFQKLFKGDRYRSRLIQNLAFGSYNKNIDKPISDNAWLSSDENNVQNYDSDDLCGFIFTLKEIYITSGWALKNKDLPIMFIAGRDDPVIVSEDKWNESREFLKKLGYTNVRGKLYKGLRHEILNENIKENIYDDIVKFMLE